MMVCSLLGAVVFPLVMHVKADANHADALIAKAEADAAAISGAFAALGELQTYAGADDAVTAEFSHKKIGDAALGVWNSSRVESEALDRAVLVSNRGDFSDAETWTFRDPDRHDRTISVPWEDFGGNARIAWFIRDESLRASAKKFESDDFLARFEDDADALMRVRQQLPRETALDDMLSVESSEKNFRKKRAAVQTLNVFLESVLEDFSTSQAREVRSALTAHALGVPADWPRKQLKIDLSDKENFTEISGRVPVEALEKFSAESEIFSEGTTVAVEPPTTSGSLGYFEHPFPIPVELKLHFGFFNPRSDGQHRARFHVTARFWNPYPFPLLVNSSDRFGLFDVENLPTIYIENENTGGSFSFSPSSFPVGQYGLVKQTPSDVTCNAYCRILDTSAEGFGSGGSALGIHGGEVYLARFPDPSAQSYGLARNTGGSSWKYQKDASKPTKAPSGAKEGAWFNPVHVINISSLPSFFLSSFLIRGEAGTLSSQTYPSDYSEPVVTFKNIYFPAFSMSLSGEDYNRQIASEYEIDQACLVWKIRLKTEDEAAMKKLFEAVEPRRGVFDFSDDAVAGAFEVSTLTGTAAAAEAEIGGDAESSSRNTTHLRDRYANEHETGTTDAFSCVRMFDFVRSPTLSAGAFRHFAFDELAPAATVGSPFPENSEKTSPNDLLDRVWFSDTEKNPHTIECDESLFVSGAFNINSENADAWAAILSQSVPDWNCAPAWRGATAGTTEKDLEYAIFIHPNTAQISLPGKNRDVYGDAELATLSDDVRAEVVFEQSVRELSRSKIRKLAEAIVAELAARRSRGEEPFASLQEFADSGLLEDALEACSLNTVSGTEVPFWAPSFISQNALIETLAPTAFPRGDTFTIYCRAEVFDPVTDVHTGTSCVSMRVQRMCEFFDSSQAENTPFSEQNIVNRLFGRRFKIISFAFHAPDEL